MSESEQPREPLSPQTHMQIVMSSKQLIDRLVAKDEANGKSSIFMAETEGPNGEQVDKPYYELVPTITEGWRGQFFKIPEEVPVGHLTVQGSADRSDPQQFIFISAEFTDATPDLGENPSPADFGAYHVPRQDVYIPLSEAIPEVAGVTEPTAAIDQSVKHEGSLDEATAQALLTDLNDIIAMQ